MNPNHWATFFVDGRQRAEALAKAGDIFAVTKCVEKKAGQQNQKGETEQKAVDEVHM